MSLVLATLDLLRRSLGILSLVLGILGALLPIIPAWPGIGLAILLLGRRDPLLRRAHLLGRQILRLLRRSPHPLFRRLGRWLSAEYVRGRRLLTPPILAAERALGRI